jgi:hypothetical protein
MVSVMCPHAHAARIEQADRRTAGSGQGRMNFHEPHSAERPEAAPAQASTGEVMVAADNQGSGLYFEWQTDGTSTWHQETVASGLYWGPPSMAVASNGTVVIAAVDTNFEAVFYWWQAYGSSTWNQQQVSGISQTEPGPVSIAVQQANPGEAGDVVIVAQNTVGYRQNPSFSYYYQAFGTTPWQTQNLPGGYDGQTSPYVTVAPNDSVDVVFSPGVVNSATAPGFYLDQLPDQSSTWSSLLVNTQNSVLDPVIVEQANGGFNEADLNQAGGVDYYWSPPNDIDEWYGQTVAGNAGSGTAQSVSMANDTAKSEFAVAATLGSCDEAYIQAYGTSPWNAETIGCPGAAASNPQIAAESTGGLIATASAESGQAYFYWQDSSDNWHTESLPGLTQVNGGQVAVDSYNP